MDDPEKHEDPTLRVSLMMAAPPRTRLSPQDIAPAEVIWLETKSGPHALTQEPNQALPAIDDLAPKRPVPRQDNLSPARDPESERELEPVNELATDNDCPSLESPNTESDPHRTDLPPFTEQSLPTTRDLRTDIELPITESLRMETVLRLAIPSTDIELDIIVGPTTDMRDPGASAPFTDTNDPNLADLATLILLDIRVNSPTEHVPVRRSELTERRSAMTEAPVLRLDDTLIPDPTLRDLPRCEEPQTLKAEPTSSRLLSFAWLVTEKELPTTQSAAEEMKALTRKGPRRTTPPSMETLSPVWTGPCTERLDPARKGPTVETAPPVEMSWLTDNEEPAEI
jgi:hypothetical protein